MRCAKCGNELKLDAKFCGKCGEIVGASTYTPPTSPHTPPTPPVSGDTSKKHFDFSMNKMPQGIALGVDERVVKQYKIGRYSFRQGSIEVIVTNKRVIRYEESNWLGMQNNQIDEINIDAIHGVSTSMMRSISIIGIVFALIFLVVGIVGIAGLSEYRRYGFSLGSFEWLIPVIGFGACALILMHSFSPSLVFYMHGAIGAPALMTTVNLRGRFFGSNAMGGASAIFQFKPTAETTVMLKEIGACIYDLKTLGDTAIDKWR